MKGKIIKWNEERGFGFIRTEDGKGVVFAHISEFNERRPIPKIGETVSFDILMNQKNKPEARNIRYLLRSTLPKRSGSTPVVRARSRRKREDTAAFGGWMSGMWGILFGLVGIALVAAALYLYYAYRHQTAKAAAEYAVRSTQAAAVKSPPVPQQRQLFRCDGRRYCSQMTSCEEAKFFLNNCLDPRMDGDDDGIPCEEQWCSF